MSVVRGPVVKLNSGFEMPVVGLGTFLAKPGEVGEAVTYAIKAGYRHFDLAAVYANEAEIGAACAAAFSSGLVTRADLFITSKLAASSMQPDAAELCLQKTLSDLKLDYVDLYLVHHSVAVIKDEKGTISLARRQGFSLRDTWAFMERAAKSGRVKSIGVSNFHVQLLNDMCNWCSVVPAVNQIERHPYWPQAGLMEFCAREGIVVTAYAPIGAPGLRDSADHGFGVTPLLEHHTIAAIALKHKKTPVQVLIRWQVETGATAVPKSSKVERIQSNFALFDFKLDADDLAAIAELGKHKLRYFSHTWSTIPIMD